MIIPSSPSCDFHKQALSQKEPHINQKEKITSIPLTKAIRGLRMPRLYKGYRISSI